MKLLFVLFAAIAATAIVDDSSIACELFNKPHEDLLSHHLTSQLHNTQLLSWIRTVHNSTCIPVINDNATYVSKCSCGAVRQVACLANARACLDNQNVETCLHAAENCCGCIADMLGYGCELCDLI